MNIEATEQPARLATLEVGLCVTVVRAGPGIVAVTSGTCFAGMACSVQEASTSGGVAQSNLTMKTPSILPTSMTIDLPRKSRGNPADYNNDIAHLVFSWWTRLMRRIVRLPGEKTAPHNKIYYLILPIIIFLSIYYSGEKRMFLTTIAVFHCIALDTNFMIIWIL